MNDVVERMSRCAIGAMCAAMNGLRTRATIERVAVGHPRSKAEPSVPVRPVCECVERLEIARSHLNVRDTKVMVELRTLPAIERAAQVILDLKPSATRRNGGTPPSRPKSRM